VGRLEWLLRKAGRQRNLAEAAQWIHAALHTEQLAARQVVVPG
jgi:hypothetical protein